MSEQNDSKAIAKAGGGVPLGAHLEGMMRFAETISQAEGVVPKAYLGKPGSILACIQTGHELGFAPMQSLRLVHVVEGKPQLDYSAMIALLKAAGYRVRWEERTSEAVRLRLIDPRGDEHVETYTMDDARTACLADKAVWKKHPRNMLSARCVSNAARAFAADVIAGIYVEDEIEEIQATTRPVERPAPAQSTALAGATSELRRIYKTVEGGGEHAFESAEAELETWARDHAKDGALPEELREPFGQTVARILGPEVVAESLLTHWLSQTAKADEVLEGELVEEPEPPAMDVVEGGAA
ncbi:MAG: hypothetical protein AAF447_16575 [Myxococcota bacterium]